MRLFCPEKLPDELMAAVRYRELRAGERLYHQGDVAVALHCVEQGRLRLVNHTLDGGTATLYVVRGGECVSEAELFAEHYGSEAVAEVRSKVCIYPKELVLAMLEKDSGLAREFMTLQAKRFETMRARMELWSIRSAKERVLQYLHGAKPAGAAGVWMDRPFKSVAEDLGLTHETVYRALARLEREGAIARNRSRIVLPERAAS